MDAREVTLKDGRRAAVRPIEIGDAPDLMALQHAVHGAGEGVVRDVSELAQTVEDLESEIRAWTEGHHRSGRGVHLVGVIDRRAVGEASAKRMRPARLRHVARIGIEVHPEAHGLGLGRALMEGLIAWARASGEVSRLDLSVFARNTRALRLYESLGFVREGERRRFIRDPDGTEHNDVIMGLLLGGR